MDQLFDVVIIGGGINGCGCAADAALRGLRVLLCEQDDLASKTSSSSSKLIHGGLRYLEHYNFRLVKEALTERQNLLKIAPHLIYPIPFVLPYKKNIRPIWQLRTGLFIYDHLNRSNQLPHSQRLHRNQAPTYFNALKNEIDQGFIFYDCATDDARLTITNALQAKKFGATIMTNTKLIHASSMNTLWELTFKKKSESMFKVKARSVINATGPWVKIVSDLLHTSLTYKITLVKGSHIIVPKLYYGNHAYMLQHDDKRIIFIIPYHGFSMIGTTDITCSDQLDQINIDNDEINYLCSIVNHYFTKELKPTQVIHSWSGVRSLIADYRKLPATLSRDYAYNYAKKPSPVITIYSGKLTTYRQLAQKAIDQLRSIFPKLQNSMTINTPLPGGSLPNQHFSDYQEYAYKKYKWLEPAILNRYLTHYGTLTETLLKNCSKMTDLGMHFSHTLYQIEIDYLIENEWMNTCEDLLWRRTKLGLFFDSYAKNALENYLTNKRI